MTDEIFTLTFTLEQLTHVQVALLEAHIIASEECRRADADRYMTMYKYIGTEKRRVLV